MTIKSAVLLALLICAGFLGNYFTIPLFFGADFLFGSIAVLLVLYFYGLGWGMLAAVVAYSYTWVLWGHPYGFINFTSEALFVGIFLQRGRRNLLGLDGIFWLLLGMPLAWLYHGIVLQMDATTATFIMLKQAINGVFNAMLVNLAICFLPLGKLFPRPKFSTDISLQESLFNLLVMMVLLPALLLTLLQTRHEKENLEARIVAELQSSSANLQFHLHSWLKQHLQAVQDLAGLASLSSMAPSAALQHETEILKQAFPNFRGLHVENALGRTIAFSPKVNEKGQSTIGHDFSDRRWFQDSKATEQPVVSEIFHGRLAALSPIIVITAPIMRENQWLGTATGTLDLKMVQEMLKPYSLGKTIVITLTDSQSQVIASTASDRTPMQVWSRKTTGVVQPLKVQMYRWHPDDQKLPSMTRWKQSFYAQEVSLEPELPWKLTIEAPVAPLQHTLYTIYVKTLAIMAILTALVLFFSLFLSRWLTRPLAQLSQVTADLPEKLSEAQDIDWPVSSALEINSLIANAKSMACTLEENFQKLHRQSEELAQANQDLLQEIQERQRTEEKLEKSLSLQRAILESTADGLLVVDRDGRIFTYNKMFAQMWKIPETVLASKKDEEALAFVLQQLKTPETFLAKVQELYGEPEAESYDVIEFQDGRIFERFSQPQRLGEKVVGRVWSFRDVTRQRQTEEALAEEAVRRRILVEQSRDGIIVLEQTGKVYEANQRFAEMLGYSCEEVRQLYVWDWDAQWTREELLEQLRLIDATGDYFETRHRRKDGTFLDVEISTNGTVLAGKKLVFCVCRDISQRKAAELALRESEEKYRLVFEKAPLGIMHYDQTSTITKCNEKFAEIIGAPKEKFIGFHMIRQLRDKKMREAVAASLQGEGGYYEGDYISVTAGKLTPVRAIFQPIFSPDGVVSGGVTIFEDITERKKAEHERWKLDKLESLGVLAGGIAHDFNNVLMGILGNLSLVSLASSVSEAQERLAAAEAACGQAQSLAQQLLTFAKGGAPVKKAEDLKEIVQEAVRLALSGSKTRAELTLPEQIWEVDVDRGQMHQVFSNLLINADQAMPTGGLIQVTAENVTMAEAARLALRPGNYVAVTLTDHGVGIAPEHLEKIFDPYFTTKQKGSGLGLSTVYAIVSQHGGWITVDAHLGRGSSFHLYLPALEGKVRVKKPAAPASPVEGRGRILVMDDDAVVREVVGKMLVKLGYEPAFAQEGREALELYAQGQTSRDPFSAVILDLTIPGGMGGREVMQRLLALDRQVKAVVSSGYATDATMADFKAHGFQGVIAKPYRMGELGRVLHEVLHN